MPDNIIELLEKDIAEAGSHCKESPDDYGEDYDTYDVGYNEGYRDGMINAMRLIRKV